MIKRNVLKVLVASLAIAGLGATAYAADNGAYVEGQLGYGNVDNSSGEVLPFSSSAAAEGVSGRVAAGYQFNQYIAVEGGYTMTGQDFLSSVQQNALDLEVKGILPLADKFNVFGKLGGAYVDQRHNADGVEPLYGLGVGYDISPQMSTDVSWTRVVGNDSIKDSNLFAVGVAYHFG